MSDKNNIFEVERLDKAADITTVVSNPQLLAMVSGCSVSRQIDGYYAVVLSEVLDLGNPIFLANKGSMQK
jgi:hypothetical protein